MPEIWIGTFSRIKESITISALKKFAYSGLTPLTKPLLLLDDVKMTWNHAKIVATDGSEALDVKQLTWQEGSSSNATKLTDPLQTQEALVYMADRNNKLIELHQRAIADELSVDCFTKDVNQREKTLTVREEDLQTLVDLQQDVFQERKVYHRYEKLQDYKLASCILSVGKHWNGPCKASNYQKGSELMKRQLMKNAKRVIRMSQMDLISSWKPQWSAHVVCHWLIEAYVVGSDNLYPGLLSEFNYLIEGEDAVNDLLQSYWRPLWQYSGPHCVNPVCKDCQSSDH